ncbi:MAG TPA: class I SAM-dependent methyltransferase [Alphaproteobacteria bacterium]
MSSTSLYDELNDGKATFDNVYNHPDPRAYFATLGRLGYCIPEQAKPVFGAVIDALKEERGTEVPTVVDIGCSYGVNAALLKYELSIDDLYARYTQPQLSRLDTETLLKRDAEFFSRQEVRSNLTIVGVDCAEKAVDYAAATGLLDAGVVADLESQPPSPAAAEQIAPADLIISTGCVGYVTDTTFDRILSEAADPPPLPWVACFALRMFPYEPIAATLAERGLVTEKLEGHSFLQRRFESADEQAHVLRQLDALGIDPTGKEDRGFYHAEFFLSRPADEVAARPLAEILPANLTH